MITRRRFLVGTSVGLLVSQQLSLAQASKKLRRVGLFGLASKIIGRPIDEQFVRGMRELGWVEGINVSYQYVYANGDMSQLDRFARDLVSQRPEVILVPAPPAVRAVSGVTKTIPMVMANGTCQRL
ncbi:MAG: ABC transporter substrate binding protein [Burkholderiaceae bacterium]